MSFWTLRKKSTLAETTHFPLRNGQKSFKKSLAELRKLAH